MKYSVHSRQDYTTLKKADEIFINSSDFESFPVVFEKFPEKTFILDCVALSEQEKEKLIIWNQWTENLVVRLYHLGTDGKWCRDNNIKFYAAFPVSTLYDCNALKDFGVEYITITIPLTHSMDYFDNYPVKLRMVPNVAYDGYIPRVNGLYGQWVRPEDVRYYKNIYIFDFEDCDMEKEKTLLHVYKENQEWPGNLNLLISNLDVNINNITIPEELGKIRANCHQKCQNNGHCKFCRNAVIFSNALFVLKEAQNE